jgi:hypothetical protein
MLQVQEPPGGNITADNWDDAVLTHLRNGSKACCNVIESIGEAWLLLYHLRNEREVAREPMKLVVRNVW